MTDEIPGYNIPRSGRGYALFFYVICTLLKCHPLKILKSLLLIINHTKPVIVEFELLTGGSGGESKVGLKEEMLGEMSGIEVH